jgi:hypothetical protein
MQATDIPFAVKLTNQENWGVTQRDFLRLMRLNPRGCFVASEGNTRLGITTTTVYGKKLGWIGNVVVDNKHRGKHIGQTLVTDSVSYLRKSRVKHIALYCYDPNVRFYSSLGFVKDQSFVRLGRSARRGKKGKTGNFLRPQSLHRLLAADNRAFGADRSNLIRSMLAEKTGWILEPTESAPSPSYMMVKKCLHDCEIGPWICFEPSHKAAKELLTHALHMTGPLSIEASCLRGNHKAVEMLKSFDFHPIRLGHRMFFDQKASIGDDGAQYALGFLDKG